MCYAIAHVTVHPQLCQLLPDAISRKHSPTEAVVKSQTRSEYNQPRNTRPTCIGASQPPCVRCREFPSRRGYRRDAPSPPSSSSGHLSATKRGRHHIWKGGDQVSKRAPPGRPIATEFFIRSSFCGQKYLAPYWYGPKPCW